MRLEVVKNQTDLPLGIPDEPAVDRNGALFLCPLDRLPGSKAPSLQILADRSYGHISPTVSFYKLPDRPSCPQGEGELELIGGLVHNQLPDTSFLFLGETPLFSVAASSSPQEYFLLTPSLVLLPNAATLLGVHCQILRDVFVCLALFSQPDNLIPKRLLNILFQFTAIDLFHEKILSRIRGKYALFNCRGNKKRE